MSPWEGANYVLPGDEKVVAAPPPPPTPAPPTPPPPAPVNTPKTTEKSEHTGAGEPANSLAVEPVGGAVPVETTIPAPGAPDPTESRPDREPRTKPDGDGA